MNKERKLTPEEEALAEAFRRVDQNVSMGMAQIGDPAEKLQALRELTHFNELRQEVLDLAARLAVHMGAPEAVAERADAVIRTSPERPKKERERGVGPGELRILSYIKERGTVGVKDIADHFWVSERRVTAAVSALRKEYGEQRLPKIRAGEGYVWIDKPRPAEPVKVNLQTREFTTIHKGKLRTIELKVDTEWRLVEALAGASPNPIDINTLATAIFGDKTGSWDLFYKWRRVAERVWAVRKKIEPNPHNPQFLETVKRRGYRLRTTIEEPEVVEGKKFKERLYTIPEAADFVAFGRGGIHNYISARLLEKGVHFVETGGTQRTQRRITEAGMEMLKQIEKARGGEHIRLGTIRERLATPRRPEEPEEKTPSRTEQAPPEKIGFSEEETLKLSHRLSDAAERLKEVYGVEIPDTVHQMWAQFKDSGGVLNNPEGAVRSLEQKLLSLAQDPVAALPNFSGNYPVEEVLMLMYPLDPVRRGRFLKELLYPRNHTFVGRWGQPVERVRGK